MANFNQQMDWYLSLFRECRLERSIPTSIQDYDQTIPPELSIQILNHILNCNDWLYKWKIKAKHKCDSWNMIDTIEHGLFYCIEKKQIWNSKQQWIKSALEINTTFTICEVIFGFLINNDDNTNLINYIKLPTKWYIN